MCTNWICAPYLPHTSFTHPSTQHAPHISKETDQPTNQNNHPTNPTQPTKQIKSNQIITKRKQTNKMRNDDIVSSVPPCFVSRLFFQSLKKKIDSASPKVSFLPPSLPLTHSPFFRPLALSYSRTLVLSYSLTLFRALARPISLSLV